MQKYGVKQSAPSDKQASAITHCPLCGQTLTIDGPTRLCSTHGSAPFEVQKAPKSDDDDDGA